MYGRGPKRPLRSLAALVLRSGKISDFLSPGGANSSYTTIIPTPQMSCSERIIDLAHVNLADDIFDDGKDTFVDWSHQPEYMTVQSVERIQRYNDFDRVWRVSGTKNLLECRPTLAQLLLNIRYVEGTRHITYTTGNVQNFNPPLEFNFRYRGEGNSSRVNSTESKRWTAEAREGARIWNTWAVLDAALQAFEFRCSPTNLYFQNKDGDMTLSTVCLEKGKFHVAAF
jgi:hypothetical protein